MAPDNFLDSKRPQLLSRIGVLQHNKSLWLDYLKANIANEDWHGARDAIVDIEVMEAELRGLATVTGDKP